MQLTGEARQEDGMDQDETIAIARDIMRDFARNTGLSPAGAHPERYLWTDAFAVCNYLELFSRTSDERCRDQALALVSQVHHTLGRHREDDSRTGWISGLSGEEGEMHPTANGLRIGKPLNERREGEPPDDMLEWDRDGQYFHYLTRWMHALNRVGRVSGDPTYTRWAIELARAAHAAFTYSPRGGGKKRMYWKMSIDLSSPQVSSMGLHDPLDGFVTFHELKMTADLDFKPAGLPGLRSEIADMAVICKGTVSPTDDPLGVGGLLSDAARIAQLMTGGEIKSPDLLETVLNAALIGLKSFVKSGTLHLPATYRLAFRELGLAIGLSGVAMLGELIEGNPGVFAEDNSLRRRVGELEEYALLGNTINGFWLDGANRNSPTWKEHEGINGVMLATSLVPRGFLTI
jgi:hypothetical protein